MNVVTLNMVTLNVVTLGDLIETWLAAPTARVWACDRNARLDASEQPSTHSFVTPRKRHLQGSLPLCRMTKRQPSSAVQPIPQLERTTAAIQA